MQHSPLSRMANLSLDSRGSHAGPEASCQLQGLVASSQGQYLSWLASRLVTTPTGLRRLLSGGPTQPTRGLPQESEGADHIQTPCHSALWSHFYWTLLWSPIASSQWTRLLTQSYPVLCQILPWSQHHGSMASQLPSAPTDILPVPVSGITADSK